MTVMIPFFSSSWFSGKKTQDRKGNGKNNSSWFLTPKSPLNVGRGYLDLRS